VAFRLGFAPTIRASRQLVVHGHIRVNRRRVARPGYLVKPSDEVSVAPRARGIPTVAESVAQGPQVARPRYLDIDVTDPFSGRVTGRPAREDVPIVVAEAAVVEFHAR
jgi:small subunit ribosomal protein S4